MKKLRQSGISTALALDYLAKAIRNPGLEVVVTDHTSTTAARRNTFEIIMRVADELGLTMRFNKPRFTITSYHYGYVVDERGHNVATPEEFYKLRDV